MLSNGKKSISNIDFDAFEHNGLDDASKILELFAKKNKRVKNIFPDEDQPIFDPNKSYGLRLESYRLSSAPAIIGQGSSSSSSDKENEKNQQPSHMRALSPALVLPADHNDEITESRPQISKTFRRDNSLRRSLFNNKRNNDEFVCSTPMPSNRPTSSKHGEIVCSTPMPSHQPVASTNSFLLDDINLSPIRDLNGINELISIGNIETDLRNQYQIEKGSSKTSSARKNRERSIESEPGVMSGAKTTKRFNRSSQSVPPSAMKPCSVVLQSMEMSDNMVNIYQQTQMKRLSKSKCNVTDVRSINIEETPVVASRNSTKKAQCDSALARKLQICNSDTEMTDDDSKDDNVDQVIVTSPPRVSKSNVFRKPSTTEQAPQNDNDSDSSLNSSTKKFVPQSILQSMKELRKTMNDNTQNTLASNTAIENQSCRVNIPKKPRKSKAKNNSKVENYFKLGKKKKSKKDSTTRKRTLYSQEEESNSSPQSSTQGSSRQSVEINQQNLMPPPPPPRPLSSTTDFDNDEIVVQNLRENHSDVFRKPGPLCSKNRERIFQTPRTSRQQQSESETENEVVSRKKSNNFRNLLSEEIVSSSTESLSRTNSHNEIESEVDETPVENLKKKRGRPRRENISTSTKSEGRQKTNKSRKTTKKTPVTHQSENELVNEEEEIHDQRREEKGRVPKTRKRKNTDLSSDDSSTTKKPRRQIIEPQNRDDDEGFESDEDFDVIYVPDNSRYSLRKRRYGKAWWIHSGSSNLRATREVFTQKDAKAEEKISEIGKKFNVNPNVLQKNCPLLFQLNAKEKLKKFKKVAKEIHHARIQKREGSQEPRAASRARSQESEYPTVSKKRNVNRMQAISEENESNPVQASIATNTSQCPSEILSIAIADAFKGLEKSDALDRRKCQKAQSFECAQFDGIEWIHCTKGVSYFTFIEESFNDGLLKIMPGGRKGKTKTRDTGLKYFILTGEATFIFNETEERVIKDLGFMHILPSSRYEIQNRGERDLIMSFMRISQPQQTQES